MEHIFAAILAGGSGQRFWPLSRELKPKQLLSMFGQESLIAQAVRRILPFAGDADHVTIVTNERLFDELRNHLTAQEDHRLHEVTYIQEPIARNTAPAIALAAAIFEAEDPDAIMVVLPSDHILEDGQVWADCISAAAAAAADGYLVTIGIKPMRPETGYGYILAGDLLPESTRGSVTPHVVDRFIEKPDLAHAEEFVSSGRYFWNAGIFVMRASRVLEELEAASEQGRRIADVARWIAAQAPADRNGEEARARFESLDKVSIDMAVMERSQRVAVIPADLAWSDVGSLLALADVAEPDEAGNVRTGRGIDIDSADSIIYSTDRLVATLGVKDIIVVDTSDATLVLDKSRVQDVRQVVEALKAQGAEEIVQPKTSLRPWGSWTSLLSEPSYQIKLIEVKPGSRLSLQKHFHRAEHWVVVSGTAVVTRDGERIEVNANESVFLPVGCVHRLENCGKASLQLIEVQVGEYLGEDDIVRLDDDWARDST
ncbi:MAG: mannose-1-phosphate guanylyltransferase/mannose-6-phosphate isomerase [Coriobacteriia bacterium]|jgi:mannose-1-phosphate guanylyltransferase/mannose-6-phosphate isomerase